MLNFFLPDHKEYFNVILNKLGLEQGVPLFQGPGNLVDDGRHRALPSRQRDHHGLGKHANQSRIVNMMPQVPMLSLFLNHHHVSDGDVELPEIAGVGTHPLKRSLRMTLKLRTKTSSLTFGTKLATATALTDPVRSLFMAVRVEFHSFPFEAASVESDKEAFNFVFFSFIKSDELLITLPEAAPNVLCVNLFALGLVVLVDVVVVGGFLFVAAG